MLMRMTSDDPKYIASHLNIFFTQDGEGYVRSGGTDNQDIEMMDWIQAAAKNIGAELCSKGGEGLCDELYDNLQYGIETAEGVIAYLYLAVLQAIEMRGRLKDIEDILGDEYDLDRLRELVQADREGRCVVLPCKLHDKVFFIENGYVKETEVDSFRNWTSGRWKISTHTDRMYEHWKGYEIDFSGIGKTVFLSREDAEKALEEMEGKPDG